MRPWIGNKFGEFVNACTAILGIWRGLHGDMRQRAMAWNDYEFTHPLIRRPGWSGHFRVSHDFSRLWWMILAVRIIMKRPETQGEVRA